MLITINLVINVGIHRYHFITDFPHNHSKCANLLAIYKTTVKNNLLKGTLEDCKKCCLNYNVLQGQKLRQRFRMKVFLDNKDVRVQYVGEFFLEVRDFIFSCS